MSDIVLLIDGSTSCSAIYYTCCRICLEEEEEFESLEAPCACSGSVKFAHRDCIQRWCNEKGNTTCEICLQKFEPGYTFPFEVTTQLIDTAVTISKEVTKTTLLYRVDCLRSLGENPGEILQTDAADKNSFCCRLVALIFTALLLIRHLFAVLTGEAEGYPFSVLTVLIVKVSGILLPMYILLQIIATMHIKHQYQVIPAALK
ncbi:hypothetical protein BUALT_Bualt13G0001200 [Buddleja alternifolia]|uniref:RING-CH-type domain-containing protein n=1 Tax=Buddleja alternifolia TaxID=168488 RepID=A0AAV6WS04_9LAMI|nr:hypothetical protein BUALT_Bualt13G0001200 [Buddleja alternifolia]